jgi:NAD(P)H-hydrate epimerase
MVLLLPLKQKRMKIFSAAQIRACDAYTIHASGISSAELMERAAAKCAEWIATNFPKEALFVVLCGTGNNGGDGLALTRMLHQQGYGVKAFQLAISETMSPDCALNLERLKHLDASLVDSVAPDTFITDIPENIIIIDAIFGTGLSRPLEGWTANFVEQINELPNHKIAIDIPSGMPADTLPDQAAAIFTANETLSFQFYKRSFLHSETGKYAGNIHLLDIGLDPSFINATQTNYQIIDKGVIGTHYRPRQQFSHKGTYGTALLIGGSYGMMGAISLSVRGALRAGAGKVRSLVPECGYDIIQSLAPEAMCMTSGKKDIEIIANWEAADAIGIGPGMEQSPKTIEAIEAFLDEYKKALVIDAGALNIIAERNELLHKIPPDSILTPHPKEFERLFGRTANSMMRLEHARTQAMRYNVVIVLKDRYTAIVTPEGECWYNINGNAGLASGGSGDVLTGIITGLLAQNYTSVQAAMLGVYLHGLSADMALEKQSMESMLAGDIVTHLGMAFKTLI